MQEAIVGYLLVAPLCTSSQLFSWFVLFIFVRVFGVLFLFFFHIRMRIFTLFLIYVRPGIPGRHTRLPGKGVESSTLYCSCTVRLHSSSPAGIYTFSGFHLACTFPRFSLFLFSILPSLLLLLNQNKLYVCLFNRVLLFKGLQY